MKKLLFKFFLTFSLVIFGAENVETNTQISGNLNISANVITNLTIKNNNMEFKEIPMSSEAIAITNVDIDGGIGNNNIITVDIPEFVVINDGSKEMILDLHSKQTKKIVLNEDGKGKIDIEGYLSSEDTTVIGDYRGSFDITFKYD